VSEVDSKLDPEGELSLPKFIPELPISAVCKKQNPVSLQNPNELGDPLVIESDCTGDCNLKKVIKGIPNVDSWIRDSYQSSAVFKKILEQPKA
jgi:hypothetical protein